MQSEPRALRIARSLVRVCQRRRVRLPSGARVPCTTPGHAAQGTKSRMRWPPVAPASRHQFSCMCCASAGGRCAWEQTAGSHKLAASAAVAPRALRADDGGVKHCQRSGGRSTKETASKSICNGKKHVARLSEGRQAHLNPCKHARGLRRMQGDPCRHGHHWQCASPRVL